LAPLKDIVVRDHDPVRIPDERDREVLVNRPDQLVMDRDQEPELAVSRLKILFPVDIRLLPSSEHVAVSG
ncbi:hypothetical protein, partial [Proteus mirabilis]|uniref:hypothetical protein n=1 Tax=Proteus mirabilis TaxID=584 RepID=UPI0019545FFC